ncbi:MAG TPA: zinc-dependent metalloprotease [Chitinophagaceae bacterium]|nr:zinc-dependent metalloprotease [Chitinophagaceae bacterium]
MIRSFLLCTCALLFLLNHLNAQPPCGFDKKHNDLLQSNPVFARQIEQNDALIKKYIDAQRAKKPGDFQTLATVTIPVVVHVMHTGGAIGTIYNPSDAQIMGAIDYLNQVYSGSYPGMTAPFGGGSVVDMEIQFALAQRTPTCGATDGIDRVDASSLPNYVTNGVNVNNTNGCPELTLKNLARWNAADYYNIWIVNKLDGADGTSGQFIAGFAYFPGAPSTLDGTIMLATQMETGEKTLPHEIGHAFNLYHPFQGSANNTQCPVNTDCSNQGDRVCDTDPIFNNYNAGTGVYSFACRSGNNPCAGGVPYTINTESNFMSYTNCYTLFTSGQKVRTQAALTLPSRASLIAPGNLALVPCGTNINFSQSAASQTENSTGTTTGCRTYRDYTYQMVIGAAPSNAATATLTYGGTAVKGIDYDVTTNGNFGAPSDVLNFAAGATSPQSFTVRIYDDGNVESAETIILDFTVNNGGGNAAKGTTAPTLTLTLSDNDTAPVGSITGTFSVGTIDDITDEAPFDARLQRQRGQFLYKASELAAAGLIPGNITSLQLFIDAKLSTRPYQNFTIRMANTSTNYLVDGSLFVIGGMTTVYTNSSLSTAAGWNLFTLSSPFAWSGNSLAVEICYDNGTADAANFGDNIGVYSDGGTDVQGNMFFQNGINCSTSYGSVSYYGYGFKPIIRLGLSAIGTAIETVASSSSTDHMDTGSNDYFYSNNNRLLMQLSSISAPLGCVATSIEGAGTVWTSYQGGQRSAKVFAVSPTTNGATASYTASFYFDNTELGGKNPSGLRIAKTSAASAAASNPSNTVFVTPAVTTLGSGTTVFTGSFTGFSRFFLVDGGVILPVSLTDFTVKLNNNQDAVLNWTAASESDNLGYEIEMSRDGSTFALLGTRASQGNSLQQQHYEYIHIKPQPGLTFYRLKQTDLDGKYEYSKIISLYIDNNLVNVSVYPVPANNKITINFGTVVSKGKIEIFSADMKTVKRENINGPQLIKDINISSLSKGIYFIRYANDTTTGVIRFIKE